LVRTIEPYSNATYRLSNNRFNFAIVVEKKGELYQGSDFMTCREIFTSTVGKILNWQDSIYNKEILEGTKLEDLQLLIVHNGAGIYGGGKFNQAIVGLNSMEDFAGFEGRSTVERVYHPTQSINKILSNAWLVKSPVEWYNSPQMLSILLWFIRLIYFNNIKSLTSFDRVEKIICGLYEKHTKGLMKYNHEFSADVHEECELFRYTLRTVLTNHAMLFSDESTGYKMGKKYEYFYKYCGARMYLNKLIDYLPKKSSRKARFNVAVTSIKNGQVKISDIMKDLYKD